MFYALLVAITVQSIGLLILTGLNVISIPDSTFPIIGTIIGAFIFGIGIVLAEDVLQVHGIELVKV